MRAHPVIAVVGLGYVGLPLAVEFGKKFRTIGYDLSEQKVSAYRRHVELVNWQRMPKVEAIALRFLSLPRKWESRRC